MLEIDIGDGTERLIAGADAGALRLPASTAPIAPAIKLTKAKTQIWGAWDNVPTHTCEQSLTISFFFDGTGNNLNADIATFEHSNVARLYRSHAEDSLEKGRYRFYLPGIGTLFKDREVDDSGGTLFGRAFGDQGQARLNWAFARLHEKIIDAEQRAENPTNKICWIRISAFGFSRGAALARAFCRDLQKLCMECRDSSTGWRMRKGGHPVALTFLGLFDTVASSGLPPSANNLLQRKRYEQRLLWTNPLSNESVSATQSLELKVLAFGEPGADPAPGFANGHAKWAEDIRLGSMVTRCVHMISAHESRNSFASDSTLFELQPNHFSFPSGTREMLYPGVHSDVGGGYRPGEGGCRTERGSQLSLIPLRVMHAEALPFVPLRALSALEDKAQQDDFAIDPAGTKHFAHMSDLFQKYCTRVQQVAVPGATHGLGGQINAHMHLYYAWKFHRIRREAAAKGHDAFGREDRIAANEQQFKADRTAIDAELKAANARLSAAQQAQERCRQRLELASMATARYGHPVDPSAVQELESARQESEEVQLEVDRMKARRLTAADDSGLNAAINKYDRMLLADARQIVHWQNAEPSLRLRPHYAALVEAYRNEYERGKGLTGNDDARLIEFFDNYVHDSMADFDHDASWPSDPRIVYVGGDRKLRYASAPVRQEATSAVA